MDHKAPMPHRTHFRKARQLTCLRESYIFNSSLVRCSMMAKYLPLVQRCRNYAAENDMLFCLTYPAGYPSSTLTQGGLNPPRQHGSCRRSCRSWELTPSCSLRRCRCRNHMAGPGCPKPITKWRRHVWSFVVYDVWSCPDLVKSR